MEIENGVGEYRTGVNYSIEKIVRFCILINIPSISINKVLRFDK